MEVVEETMEADENFPVIKARSTNRRRLASPLSHASTSSIGGASSGEGEDGHIHGHGNDGSSSVIGGTIEYFKNTNDEEDMANCLILLAQGCNKRKEQRRNRGGNMEPREGLDAYKCKTCNRSFPSFQALGGHRASHSKSKATTNDEKKGFEEGQFNSENSDQPVVLPADHHHHMAGNNSSKAKVHECLICASEFSSGQALGGHMRRHRNTTVPAVMNKEYMNDQKSQNVLRFDLNLPAPPEEEVLASKQPFIFSAPALVDCYY